MRLPYCQRPDGERTRAAARPTAILPGSFNPLHAGHRELAAVARTFLGDVAFELSIANVDKPDLSPADVDRRLAHFLGEAPIWVTRAATFAEKAELFPGAAFVVGHDTAVRLLEPRYYDGDAACEAALRRLAGTGCRFLVGGRLDAGGTFRTWDSPAWPGLFLPLTESQFRADVSSTALRGSRETGADV